MIVVVRHGQTSLNAEGRLAGRLDVALTEVGKAQAHAAASAVLAAGTPARVISSPLVRARQTAAAFGMPVEIDERWTELDYGEYDGRPVDEVGASVWDAWRSDVTFAPPGGESIAELGVRVRSACGELVEEVRSSGGGGGGANGPIVVVSHVSPIKAAVAWALGVDDAACWRMYLAPGSVTRIGVAGRTPRLEGYNDTSHLVAGL